MNLINLMKREIEKFPYGTGSGLSDIEARKNFLDFCKEYGPLTLRIGLIAFMMSSPAYAADTPPSGPAGTQCAPTSSPNQLNVLPATKELVGIAAVGLVCAAASASPVTAMGIAACLLTVAAKACNKL